MAVQSLIEVQNYYFSSKFEKIILNFVKSPKMEHCWRSVLEMFICKGRSSSLSIWKVSVPTPHILVKRVFNYYQPYILGTLKCKTSGTFALDPYPTQEEYKFSFKATCNIGYKKIWGVGTPPHFVILKNLLKVKQLKKPKKSQVDYLKYKLMSCCSPYYSSIKYKSFVFKGWP